MRNRRAYTLVELLMVITIIVILAGLSLSMVGGAISASRQAKTDTILQRWKDMGSSQERMFDILQRRFHDRYDGIASYPPKGSYLYDLKNTYGVGKDILVMVAKKDAYKKLMDPTMWNTELDDDLPQVDAWGNSIRFYLWPTRLFRDSPTATKLILAGRYYTSKDLARDPEDPLGLLVSIPNFEANFHTPCVYHIALYVSAGPDGKLGLYEPTDVPNFGYLAAPIPGADEDLMDNQWSTGR